MKEKEVVVVSGSIEDIITEMKNKTVELIPWGTLVREYDPSLHEIVTNKRLRPDKKKATGGYEKVARVTYGQQKLAARRMTQMAFSIPVKRLYDTGTDPVKIAQAQALEAIYREARINSQNIKRMNAYFASCEIATVWFPVPKPNDNYGFKSEFELRCKTFTPMQKKFSRIECAELFPIFDKYGDMTTMGFGYTYTEKGQTVEYFELYTKEQKFVYKKGNNGWEDTGDVSPVVIGKHPLAYLSRPIPIWEGTTNNTQEVEFALSRESDIIKKNSAPLVKVKGKLLNNANVESDAAREVYQLEGDGDVSYVTWTQQIDAMKFFIQTLKQNTEEELQLPNLSMENIKGMGVVSGESRKTLLTDAHLKVGDESGDIIEFFDRECNIIKAFLGQMNSKWKESIRDLKVSHLITPFIQNDEAADIDKFTKATGGKAIMSQIKAVKMVGFCETQAEIDEEIKALADEASAEADMASKKNVFEQGSL